MSFQAIPLLDPLPDLADKKIDTFYAQISCIIDLLSESNALQKVCESWIRNSIINNIHVYDPEGVIESKLIDESVRQKLKLDDKSFAILGWAEVQWAAKLESLFLSNKDYLDQLSCKLIRIDDRYFAYELYHRIKASEITFDQASYSYGKEPERSRAGQFSLQSISSLPKQLVKPLLGLKQGQILKPVSFGSEFAILQLIEWVPAKFDQDSKVRLLQLQLNTWLDESTSVMMEYINNKTTETTLSSNQ